MNFEIQVKALYLGIVLVYLSSPIRVAHAMFRRSHMTSFDLTVMLELPEKLVLIEWIEEYIIITHLLENCFHVM